MAALLSASTRGNGAASLLLLFLPRPRGPATLSRPIFAPPAAAPKAGV